jgi:hypothetical protein
MRHSTEIPMKGDKLKVLKEIIFCTENENYFLHCKVERGERSPTLNYTKKCVLQILCKSLEKVKKK